MPESCASCTVCLSISQLTPLLPWHFTLLVLVQRTSWLEWDLHMAHDQQTLNVCQAHCTLFGLPEPLGFHMEVGSARTFISRDGKNTGGIGIQLLGSEQSLVRPKGNCRVRTLAMARILFTRNGVQYFDSISPDLIWSRKTAWSTTCQHG